MSFLPQLATSLATVEIHGCLSLVLPGSGIDSGQRYSRVMTERRAVGFAQWTKGFGNLRCWAGYYVSHQRDCRQQCVSFSIRGHCPKCPWRACASGGSERKHILSFLANNVRICRAVAYLHLGRRVSFHPRLVTIRDDITYLQGRISPCASVKVSRGL